jgi:hypothetical protein
MCSLSSQRFLPSLPLSLPVCLPVQLIAAAERVLVSNCHDCVLHLGTPRPPLLTGDCRFVRLAPFNTRYEQQVKDCYLGLGG